MSHIDKDVLEALLSDCDMKTNILYQRILDSIQVVRNEMFGGGLDLSKEESMLLQDIFEKLSYVEEALDEHNINFLSLIDELDKIK